MVSKFKNYLFLGILLMIVGMVEVNFAGQGKDKFRFEDCYKYSKDVEGLPGIIDQVDAHCPLVVMPSYYSKAQIRCEHKVDLNKISFLKTRTGLWSSKIVFHATDYLVGRCFVDFPARQIRK